MGMIRRIGSGPRRSSGKIGTKERTRLHERRLIRFFKNPDHYPHPAGRIEERETHISRVFLAGRFAYKLKKPVRFPFLNASGAALRRTFCRLEVRLNRRLAPDLYLGVLPVKERDGRLRLGGRGRTVDWVVRMRRLPEDRMLDRLIARRRVSRRQIEETTDRILQFFRSAACSRRIDRYGDPAFVSRLVLGNLRECRPFVGALLSQVDFDFIEAAFRQFLTLREPLLRQRVREGRIIEGHGDLRCENICLTRPPVIFDCVEFEPALRRGDMLNDVAFLVMDLEFRGRKDLARAVMGRYRRMRDPAADRVLPFYQCYRSIVRGKVRALIWKQHPRTARGQRMRRLSRRHFKLAKLYASRFSPPRLIVVGGMIGSGKSRLAGSLAGSLGAILLRTDAIRLQEFGRFRRKQQGFSQGLYAPRVSGMVYRRLIRRARVAIRHGRSVVCDGTFSQASGRQALRRIARERGASFHFFECTLPKRIALRRIGSRLAGKTDISEARPEYYDRMKAEFEPVRGWGPRDWSRISTAGSPAATDRAALNILRRFW
ncbi:MAG: AAA family ATPase [Candidatus Omnitrophica bacterium]|nr:AAA family ATPase [Candidatus Omnitrophota bacterium]